MFVPNSLYIWLILSALIVLYDAAYVLLRPDSVRGGKYFHIFSGYDIYIKYDTLYAENNDSFVVIQSWLNIVEAILLLISVFLSLSSNLIFKIRGAFLVIVTSGFVFWKTVIFLIYDKDFITPAVKQLTSQALLYYVFPSSLWIIFPLLSVFVVSRRIANQISNKQKKQ